MGIKRILSTLLAFAALLGAMSMTAFAESETAVKVSSSYAAPAATGLSLNRKSLSVFKGSTYRLKLSSSRKCTWTSSNKAVATVSADGVVKGVKAGTCTVTCRLSNGTKLKCTVTVKDKVTFAVDRVRKGVCRFHVTNKTTKKTVKYLTFTARELDSTGKFLREITVKCGAAQAPGTREYYEYNTAGGAAKCYLTLKKVTFTDGTTWKP